jgi:signal transduction histidine kinase
VLGRELVGEDETLPDVLQRIADEAKAITAASYTAVVLARPGHPEEISHFAYNAPRELFPERLPRLVGLLDVPIRTRQPARIDDIRGHPAGVGIPVQHPPIGPLLAVPILTGDEVLGEIAVAGAPGERVFDTFDEQVIIDLAAHTATAVGWVMARDHSRADAILRREVVATARHDIRNPLTIAKGYMALLQRRREQMSTEQLEAAIVATRGALERIDEFASRAFLDETDRLAEGTPAWQLIDLRAFIEELARDHNAATQAAAPDHNRISISTEFGAPEFFAGDRGMVRQVLDNLVSNALKYGAAECTVTVTTRSEGAQVRFDVHNLGQGIPLEDQQRLFDPYWRAPTVRADGVPGTGLGLAIVRRLVELHNGVLGVTSRPDEGTTFWVTFPQAIPPTETSGDPADDVPPTEIPADVQVQG